MNKSLYAISPRAGVCFTDAFVSFHVQLPTGGTPANVAAVLLAVSPRLSRQSFEAGLVAADFLSCVSPTIRARLVGSMSSLIYQVDTLYQVSHTLSYGPRVRVAAVSGNQPCSPALFDGQLYAFTDWAAKQTGLEGLLKKIVRFVYDGGSEPGKTRTIRVEAVGRNGFGVVTLEGYDLDKDDLKAGYRKYLSDKIRGEITVVN